MIRYYLDTNAWVDLLRSEAALLELITRCRSKRLEIVFSQENSNELLENDNISDATRERDLPRLVQWLDKVQPDEIAILGQGKLGMMKFASPEKSLTFDRHIYGAKKKDRNTTADGVHLINALSHQAILVTADVELIASAQGEGLTCISLREFLEAEHLTFE